MTQRVSALTVLLIVAAGSLGGCGVVFDQDLADARAACPSLSEAEFDLLIGSLQIGRANGATQEEVMDGIPDDCAGGDTGFPDEVECRECLVAATIAVHGN